MARERAYLARFKKSHRNHQLERSARDFILLDRRFQRPSAKVKSAILQAMGLAGDFTASSFDLIMTPTPEPVVTVDALAESIERITLIEMKTTAQRIRNIALAGYFFGSSETQYNLSDAAGSRLLWAFVVMNEDNDYGRPFFCLLTFDQVKAKTRTKRVQFQVNFAGSDMAPPADEAGPFPDPDFM